jgi:hypothetical protein
VDGVTIAVTTIPTEVVSGDVFTMTIRYTNDNALPLTDARLAIRFPSDIHIHHTEPAGYTRAQQAFPLGTIAPGAGGTATIEGHIIADIGSTERIIVALSYRVGDSTKQETKTIIAPIAVTASALHAALTFPDFVVDGAIAPFTIQYANTGQDTVTRGTIAPTFAAPFRFIDGSLPLVNGVFALPTLGPGVHGTITGRVAVDASGATSGTIVLACAIDGTRACAEDLGHHVAVFIPKFTVRPVANGDASAPIMLGSTAVWTLAYENNEESDVVDVRIAFHPPAGIFVTSGTPFSFSPATHPELAVVRKGTRGGIPVTVTTKATVDRAQAFGAGDPVMKVPYTLSYRLASRPDREIAVARMDERAVATDLRPDAFARYFTPEGDQLGRGPLPPRVGDTTTYWIFLSLLNTISDADDVVVRAHVPASVEWSGHTSVSLGDPIAFDPATRTLTWRIGRVTRFTGGAFPDVGVAFEVGVTPEAGDVGKPLTLLDQITVRGTDTFTKTVVERTGPVVTTDVAGDPRMRGQGNVVAAASSRPQAAGAPAAPHRIGEPTSLLAPRPPVGEPSNPPGATSAVSVPVFVSPAAPAVGGSAAGGAAPAAAIGVVSVPR